MHRMREMMGGVVVKTSGLKRRARIVDCRDLLFVRTEMAVGVPEMTGILILRDRGWSISVRILSITG